MCLLLLRWNRIWRQCDPWDARWKKLMDHIAMWGGKAERPGIWILVTGNCLYKFRWGYFKRKKGKFHSFRHFSQKEQQRHSLLTVVPTYEQQWKCMQAVQESRQLPVQITKGHTRLPVLHLFFGSKAPFDSVTLPFLNHFSLNVNQSMNR